MSRWENKEVAMEAAQNGGSPGVPPPPPALTHQEANQADKAIADSGL